MPALERLNKVLNSRWRETVLRFFQNHTRDRTGTGGQEVAEIQVACQNDPLLPDCLGQNLIVRHSMEALFAKMHYLFACFTQRANGCRRNAHVGQKFHAAGLANG